VGIEQVALFERQEILGCEAIDVEVQERAVDALAQHEGGMTMLGKLFRFRIGFALGYLVAVIRRADENDPMIRGLKRVEEGVRQELKKVNWPTREELTAYTIVVLVSVVVLTSFVFGLDYVFSKGVLHFFAHRHH